MMFLVLLLPQHPLHMWKYQVTLYHFSSRALLTRALNADLQLRKQPALASFFFHFSSEVLDLWPGLVGSPNCHHWLAFIGSRTKCLFSLPCWEWEMGGTLVYHWVGPLRCVRSKICPLHTTDWQVRQGIAAPRTLDSSHCVSFLKHNNLKS